MAACHFLDGALIHAFGQFLGSFSALTVSVGQKWGNIARQQREFEQFLHHVDHAFVVWRGLHSPLVVKLLVRLSH